MQTKTRKLRSANFPYVRLAANRRLPIFVHFSYGFLVTVVKDNINLIAP